MPTSEKRAVHPVVQAIESLLDSALESDEAAKQAAGLLAAHITQMVPRDQRALCSMLVERSRIPAALIQQMLVSQLDGFEHFVANAKVISEDIGLQIVRVDGPGHITRALARRSDTSIATQRAMRALGDPAVDRAMELRQVRPVATPVVEASKPLIDLRPDRVMLTADEVKQLFMHAGEQDAALLSTAITDKFGLPFMAVKYLLTDGDTEAVAALMRYLGVRRHEACRMFTVFGWRRFPDQALRDQFATAFDLMDNDKADRIIDEIAQPSKQDSLSVGF